jgi:hypothetical protein
MSRILRRVSRFDASAEQMLAAATAPDFLQARVKPGTSAGASVVEVARDGRRLVQELISQDYARTKTGGIDPSRTARSVTRYVWDLSTRRCTWDWRGPEQDRIRLSGTIAVHACGAQTELEAEFQVDVRLPLIGGLVERIIASEIEADLPRFEALVREIVARGG